MPQLHAQKEARLGKRISLAEAANDTSISRQTFSAWYKNEVNTFYPDVIEALCNYYGCAIGELLEIVPAEKKPGQRAPDASEVVTASG